MKVSYSSLMMSKFFNPAFNSAIFDGPFRIYFAQIHESLALKIYFSLQQKFPEAVQRAKDCHKARGINLLIMVYPSADAFQMSFEGERQFLIEDQLAGDTLIGVNGPFEDDKLHSVLHAIEQAISRWPEPNVLPFELEAQL
jgi:hypothetical protein